MYDPGRAVGNVHHDTIHDDVDGDFVDVALPRWIGEAGAEGDTQGGRGDYGGEPRRRGCRAADLVIWIGVAKGGADDGGSYDE